MKLLDWKDSDINRKINYFEYFTTDDPGEFSGLKPFDLGDTDLFNIYYLLF